MKQIFTILLLLFCSTLIAQSNEEIAGVYIKKSRQSLEGLKFQESLDNFNKAVKFLDTIKKPAVAKLGMDINYEMGNFYESKKFAKQYFDLETNKASEEYQEALVAYVELEEKIVAIEEEKAHQEKLRIAREKELKRIDSLKTLWSKKSDELSFEADTIYAFNKKNMAVFGVDNKYGIVNAKGEVTIKPDYEDFLSHDGYIVFKNKKVNPTEVYTYNINSGSWEKIPPASDFNPSSTNYGVVTFPRANGRIVMYPDNSALSMVYDIESKKFVQIANLKDLLKGLKKNDKIDKYDEDDRTIRLDKVWYNFGSHIGNGVYDLYNKESKKLHGFLFTNSGDEEKGIIKKAGKVNTMGAFYDGKAQAFDNGKVIWVNKIGVEVSAPKNENGIYTGDVKIKKLDKGKYHFMINDVIIKGNEKLEKMIDFLRKNSPQNEGVNKEEAK